MKVLRIGLINVRRFLRDRTSAFVALVMPLLLILLLGLMIGESAFRMGLVAPRDGSLANELEDAIRSADGVHIVEYSDREELLDALDHNDRDGGVIIPTGYDATLRAGGNVEIEYMATSDADAYQFESLMEEKVSAHAAKVAAARFAGDAAGVTFEAGLASATAVEETMEPIDVRIIGVGGDDLEVLGEFDVVSASMLVLFVFLIGAAAGASQLIQARNLGVSRRMLGTPTAPMTIIAGETSGRFFVAFGQTLAIVIAAALVFSVDWGNWLATLATLALFALVSAGAGMLLGAFFRSDQLAGNVGTFVALAMAMLGGSMSGGVGTSPYVPHTWANQALGDVMARGAGLTGIATELGVLALFAVGFIGLAALAFRRSITHAHG